MVDRRYGSGSPDWHHAVQSPSQAYAAVQPRHAAPPRPVAPTHPVALSRPAAPPRQFRTLRGFFRRPDAHRRNWLLLIPIVVPLTPFLYNRVEPTFIGLPFFYWSQLGFAFLASIVIAFVHTRSR
jgi:hypothetical protein